MMQRGYFVGVPGGNTSFARAELSGLTMENKLQLCFPRKQRSVVL